jgi:hypothetical protein
MKARIIFTADCELEIPEWAEGETDQDKLTKWIESARQEPIEALRCVDAKWIITGELK